MLCRGACALHCRMFTTIPGFYPLNASNIPRPSCANQKCLQMLSDTLHPTPGVGGRSAESPLVQNSCLNPRFLLWASSPSGNLFPIVC